MQAARREAILQKLGAAEMKSNKKRYKDLAKTIGAIVLGTAGGEGLGMLLEHKVNKLKRVSPKNRTAIKAVSRFAAPVLGALGAGLAIAKTREIDKQLKRAMTNA